MTQLRLVDSSKLVLHWERFQKEFAKMLSFTPLTEKDIFVLAEKNLILLAEIIGDEGESYGLLLLEQVNYPSVKFLRVLGLVGEDIDMWLEDVSRILQEVARGLGAVGIEASTRAPIAKKLRKLGWTSELAVVQIYV